MKTFLRITGGIIFLLGMVLVASVTTIDRTHYQKMPYYKEWKQGINELKITNADTSKIIKVGWAKVNITPPKPMAMAGKGVRKGKPYTSVHDSIYVRSLFIENGLQKYAIISADLLIIPPSVTALVEKKIANTGLSFAHVYLGATHSHNSIGGWYNTLVGELFAGPYDPGVEEMIADALVKSILLASQNVENASVTFEKDLDDKNIKNRLIDDGEVAPYIRTLRFKTQDKTALLTTYAAHATVLNSATMALSGDFPSVLLDSLEKTDVDFAMYMAGTVASMAPLEIGENDFDEVNNQALGVYRELLSKNEFEQKITTADMASFQLPLPLRKASPKISPSFALRPWVFKWLFGNAPNYVKVLKIGDVLMVGLPCDFSGELMKDLDNYASQKGLNLIITSFNGGYTGYITADERFDLDRYETITMNWFGPYNGAYFSEVVRDIIDKVY